jgi:hypothetical protein
LAIVSGGGGAIARSSKAVEFDKRTLYEFYGAPKPDGVTEKSLEIVLPKNAVVKKYEVVIAAAPAHAVRAGEAGQVRTTGSGGTVTAILDFGTPRTVSAIGAPEGADITSISTWTGVEFFSPPKYSSDGENFARLPSEVRTERLQVEMSGGPTTDAIANGMVLVLPESPAGIDLRIDGGPPVFSQPSAVEPGNSADLSAQSWSSESTRVVDLGPALAALTGDPLDESTVTFTATVTSRVPGTLDLQLRPGGQDVRRVRRALFNGQPPRDVAFDAEGRQSIVLDSLPENLTVNEVRLTVAAAPATVRVVPPLGPEPPTPSLASFSFTTGRAACIQLPAEPRLMELTGMRLPLAAGASGAEVRVLLWKSGTVDRSPAEPLENGASEPLTIDGEERWRTFSWKKPIPAPKDFALWAALIVNRGEASMTFADAGAGIGAEPFLWGAPTGPWHDLPAALVSARGRIRVIGKPRPDTPFPPLRIELGAGGAGTDVTPNVKGVAAMLTGISAPQGGPATLVLTSYTAATLTLKEIDVTSTS